MVPGNSRSRGKKASKSAMSSNFLQPEMQINLSLGPPEKFPGLGNTGKSAGMITKERMSQEPAMSIPIGKCFSPEKSDDNHPPNFHLS